MARDQALQEIKKPFHMEDGLIAYLKQRLDISSEELEIYLTQPRKTYRDFTTYKKTFERMRPFFWLMAKLNLIPYSFYIKYTKPDPLCKASQ